MRPKNLQLTFVWIVFASLIMGGALWQAQVSVARNIASKTQKPPPPSKTRHAVRPPLTDANPDPVADYIARCGKGMTIQDIRWILSDFENSGLDLPDQKEEPSAEAPLAYRGNERRWYLDTLAEGLHLTHEQTVAASAALADLFQKARQRRVDWLDQKKTSNSEDSPDAPRSIEEIFDNLDNTSDPVHNGMFTRMMPWNLCQLTPMQERITWKPLPNHSPSDQKTSGSDQRAAEQIDGNNFDGILKKWLDDPQERADMTGGPLFALPTTTEPYDVFAVSSSPPSWVLSANSIFPLLDSQKLNSPVDPTDPRVPFTPDNQKKFIQQVRLLHPVQLKMALLLHSGLEEFIRKALDTGTN